MTRFVVLSLGIVLASAIPSPGQSPSGVPPAPASAAGSSEEGRPLVRTYQPIEIGGGSQTWCIVQDRRGVLYFGANSAVLEFDGASWRRIPVGATGAAVRSMAIDDAGRIYVGSVGTFGYLEPDATGALRFASLIDRLPSDAPAFNDVWRTFVTKDGVWFQTARALFRWANGAMAVIRPASGFNRATMVNGQVYLTTPETGLNVIEGTTLRPLPGTDRLKGEPYPILLPYDEKRLLVGTRLDGLFLYDGRALERFTTVDQSFTSTELYRGIVLPDQTFALTTTDSGLIILDRNGRRVFTANRGNGLPSDTVYFAMRDREGALWLGLDNGIARVETPSPLSYFGQADGLGSAVLAAVRFDGRLFLGHQAGAAYLAPSSNLTPAHFEKIVGVGAQCWAFERMADPRVGPAALAAACGDGLFEVAGTRATPIKAPSDLSFRPNALTISTVDPTRLWIPLFDGLASFRRVAGKWIDEGRVEGIADEVRTLFENPDGSVWAGTAGNGVLRLTPESRPGPNVPRPAMRVEHFGEADGLPAGGVIVTRVGDAPIFSAGFEDPHFVRFDEPSHRFARDRTLDGIVGVNPVFDAAITGQPDGRLYLNRGRQTVVLRRKPDGTWDVDRSTFARLGSTPITGLFPDARGVAWLQFGDGRFVRFDTSRQTDTPVGFPVLIRKVSGVHDRALFAGGGAIPAGTRLAAASNALRFEFSAPTYIDESATEYQSRLDGLDTEWSAWTREPQREYTNLGLGEYHFRVRARSVTGTVSDEAVYAFTILPPWYRTWWAYGGYLALALLGFAGADRVMRRRVVAKERQRAQFAEARVRAEAAEALAQAETERKKNVELLSEMGREITSSLDFETIFGKLYEKVNELADADVFGVGLYRPDSHEIEYRMAIEKGKRYEPYSRDTTDRQPAAGLVHRAPRAGLHQRSAERVQPLHPDLHGDEPAARRRLDVAGAAVADLPAARCQGPRARHHHDPELREVRLHRASPERAPEPGVVHGHRARQRRRLQAAERARARDPAAVRRSREGARHRRGGRCRQELVPLDGQPRAAHAAHVRPRLRQDHQETTGGPHLPAGAERRSKSASDDPSGRGQPEGRRQRGRAADQADRRRARSREDRGRQARMAHGGRDRRRTSSTARRRPRPRCSSTKGLKLAKQMAPDLPAVTGDRDRLIQVVINLISNAVKFTDTGTHHLPRRTARRRDSSSASSTRASASRRPISRRCSSASSRSAIR